MSSIQERLQLKRVPLDTWNVREQLCLASAVVRSGDQNWMSVSRALKTVGEPNRPADWYSQKSCAAQYGALLEHVETPKRKKRSSEGAAETPQESILKRLTQERIVEIQKNVAEMTQQVEQLKSEVQETRTTATSEDRLRELWAGVEAARRLRERESQRRAAWLREREERRARAERNWRPTQRQTPGTPEALSPAKPAAPSSPLLTSLLKSSPVVTTPQHITHPANVVETISPSAGAPTLSMLLEKVPGSTTPTSVPLVAVGPVPVGAVGMTQLHHNKDAAIEHIKSQLVQIEQQLSAATPPPPPVTLGASLDDIEIKAEDVYAFSDVDIHIPPVPTVHMHKPVGVGLQDKPPTLDDPPAPPPELLEVKEEPLSVDDVPEDLPLAMEAPPPLPEVAPAAPPEPEARISFPEVKFPTTEIKVIQPESKVKEEVPQPSPSPPPLPSPAPGSPEEPVQENVEVKLDPTPVEDNSALPPLPPEPSPPPALPEVPPEVESPPSPRADSRVVEIPLPEESGEDAAVDVVSIDPPLPEPEPETVQSPPAAAGEPPAEPLAEIKVEDSKRDDDAEDSIPLKEMAKEESAEPEEPHTETDDDTPMELVREEEKDGKKKRDYSRKKKPDSRTCSGSESAEASAPESPGAGASAGASPAVAGAGGLERQRKLWKKSVMLVYSRLCAHKYASLFLRPITDEEAPGYSVVVRRPMDLTTIRRQMEAGQIRTTAEFQRDILLMLSNALMYNSSEHSVYAMAKEMYDEAQNQLGMLLAAQAHAGLAQPPPPRRKRRRADSPALPTAKRHH